MQHTREGRVGHQNVARSGQRRSGVRLVRHAQRVAAGRRGNGVCLIVSSADGWFDFVRRHLETCVSFTYMITRRKALWVGLTF